MNHETALNLSAALAEAGISHTIQVGHHENMNPQIQCRIDVLMPRRYEGGLAEAIARIEKIGKDYGVALATSMMGDGLTFSSPTPGAFLREAGLG